MTPDLALPSDLDTPTSLAAPRSLAEKQSAARAWFETLRDRLVARLEAIEDAAPAELYGEATEPSRFLLRPWTRPEGGGGVMGVLKGRVFEKAGIHVSTVMGEFSPEMAKAMPGADGDPRFFATGVSVILHPRNPHAPTGHMNTRFIVTTREGFGGGGDLTPVLAEDRRQDHPDTLGFKAAYKTACDAYAPGAWEAFQAHCDRYFHLAHRDEPRGTGGIFYEHLNSGDFDRDLAFTRSVGEAFLGAYPDIVARRMAEPWTDDERNRQCIQRGRYVEFNLLYDRGTTFGLKVGGNIEAILSSMPPEARWP